jgi:flagellar biosynthesis/type III secretory pathway protein FliH
MSDVIKLNRRPTSITAYSSSAAIFHTSEEQEKENHQTALHNHYAKGLEDGQKAVKEKIEQEFNERLLRKYAELTNLISDLNEHSVQLESQFEQLVMNVGFILAEAIMKREIERESIFKDVLDESLKKVLGANEIIVRLHPKDYESIVVEGKSFQMKDSFSQIKFEKDDRIELGGCFIESEIGNADGRISSQLNELKRKLDMGFKNH